MYNCQDQILHCFTTTIIIMNFKGYLLFMLMIFFGLEVIISIKMLYQNYAMNLLLDKKNTTAFLYLILDSNCIELDQSH